MRPFQIVITIFKAKYTSRFCTEWLCNMGIMSSERCMASQWCQVLDSYILVVTLSKKIEWKLPSMPYKSKKLNSNKIDLATSRALSQ